MDTTELRGSSLASTIHFIEANEIPSCWPHVRPVLERYSSQYEDFWSLNDVYKFLNDGLLQLWIVRDQMGPYFYLMTEMRVYPQCKVAEFVFAAGKRPKQALQHLDFVEQWAINNGAKFIREVGRLGWEKYLVPMGYKATRQVRLVKELQERKLN